MDRPVYGMICLEKRRNEQGFSYRDTELVDATWHGMILYEAGTRCFEFRTLFSLRFVSERNRRGPRHAGARIPGIARTHGPTVHVSHPFDWPLAITSHTFAISHATRSILGGMVHRGFDSLPPLDVSSSSRKVYTDSL